MHRKGQKANPSRIRSISQYLALGKRPESEGHGLPEKVEKAKAMARCEKREKAKAVAWEGWEWFSFPPPDLPGSSGRNGP
ncbi:MAG: hypothetical protein RLZZ32_1775 [Cyanobacteriota bacterium]|jgi:hypothetical protein